MRRIHFVVLLVAAAALTATALTTASDTSNSSDAGVATDATICRIPYKNMNSWSFTVDTSSSSSGENGGGGGASGQSGSTTTTFLFSISPCANTTILSPSGAVCGMGFAGWTERTPQHNSTCMYVYTRNLTSDSSTKTIYATTSGDEVLVVNWKCTGLEDDTDPTKTRVLAVTGNRTRREVTIETKGCLDPDTSELRAGVIVAICVVAVFVFVVILSVVKTKCFGGGSSSGSSGSLGGGGGAIGDGYHAAP